MHTTLPYLPIQQHRHRRLACVPSIPSIERRTRTLVHTPRSVPSGRAYGYTTTADARSIRGAWQMRWFEINKDRILTYAKDKVGSINGEANLEACKVELAEAWIGVPLTIRLLTSKQVVLFLKASSEAELKDWMHAIISASGHHDHRYSVSSESISLDDKKGSKSIYQNWIFKMDTQNNAAFQKVGVEEALVRHPQNDVLAVCAR